MIPANNQFHRATFAILLLIGGGSSAHAQKPAAGDLATAEAIFVEGKRLFAHRDFAEACARFEASMTLVPRLGVQLNLGDCYEHLGKTASAWVTFGEAALLARRLADRREDYARQRRDALAPRLSRLNISLSNAGIDGLAVARDGALVEPSAYGLGVPVDPGVHLVEVTARERIPWSTRVVISGDGETIRIEVPELRQRPAAAPTGDSGRRRPTPATWIAAGVSAAGIGTGTVLGLAARSLWNEARSGCDASNICTDAAYRLVQRSRRDGNLSTIAFAIGGVALVTSVILYRRSPRDHERAVRLVPDIAPRAGGVAVIGAF